ncbi:lipocalin family protein [Telluribacter sp.]|jgi:apolipoprotein D and lipocalin family protein|uniref:lipocalin family protein n=1 Tax=Telluribacter sp. TaxID=1978767 RepID=UPI002E12766A|nr:lipocalin family protein [Telluribacter sp.]
MNKSKLLLGGTLLSVVAIWALSSCRTIPKGVAAVQPFDAEKYLGKWYEIARFNYRFEKNLNNVTATYSLNPDGSIKVDNRGYNFKKQEWEDATGKAKFVEDANTGKLKVSFFGPFYSGYNVIALDPEYKYEMVAGKDRDYLWLLSRETTMPESVKQKYLEQARSLGYDTSELIWVEHTR